VIEPVVAAFLARRRVAHLATASANGLPHAVPVCFALVDQTVYSAIDDKPKSGRPLRRIRNVLDNPRAVVVADVYDDRDWSRLGFVLLHGAARLIEPSTPEHALAVAELRARYAQYTSMALELRPVLAIDVQRVTTWGQLDR
jgi:PPOX class probable F420-dependent enzyme